MLQLRTPLAPARPIYLDAPAMQDHSWLEVNLDRLERNARAMLGLLHAAAGHAAAPRRKPPILCGVVKKDGYGLGAGPVAHRLVKAGCRMLAVYSPQEVEHLAQQSITTPVLLLSPLRRLSRTDALYRPAVAERLHLTIHDPQGLDEADRIGRDFGIRLPVHLHLDTGMSRMGLTRAQFDEAVAGWPARRSLRLAGVYSHLATADDKPEFAYEQLARFERAVADHADRLPPGVCLHLSNSFGMLRDPRFHLDMVRPGLGLYGYAADLLAPGPVMAEVPRFEPVARWMSRLIHVGDYPRRAPVGYGSTHKLKRPSVLGTVPVGYGDGYPLLLGGRAQVRVLPDAPGASPFLAKVLGRVNMDQLVVDLTDAPATDPTRLTGSIVEVYSDDPAAPHSVTGLAKLAKSHPYEMLCRVGDHIPRRYVSQKEPRPARASD